MASTLSSFLLPTAHLGFQPLLSNPPMMKYTTPLLLPVSISTSKFSPKLLSHKSRFSHGDVDRLQLRRSRYTVFANPTEGDIVKEESKGSEGQGPPVLTILAGVVVFFSIFWMIGSIVMWLVSLTVNLPPTK